MELMGLWVGLVASIVGIVLSIVAMVFAFAVDQRSRTVTNQTIQSLQKIETTVERMSSDTEGLVKAAWDKLLLGGQHGTAVPTADVQTPSATVSPESAALGGQGRPRSLSRVDMVMAQLANVSPAAVELARLLARGRHLTHKEYHQLRDEGDYFAHALKDLRDVGLLVELKHEGEIDPVFWFPSGAVDHVLPAATLLRPTNRTVAERVANALSEAIQRAGESKDVHRRRSTTGDVPEVSGQEGDATTGHEG
ncbi:MAG TPA: hypothetical protein VEW95_00665 [Candidatus Limnocylindrales bacterium]|nr:hypothetical protein [Candidatus Limnocylindrales bacterium]